MELARVVEGRTKLLVPKDSLVMRPPPTTPAFYNPEASVNRDVSVAIVRATTGESFCDAMAAVGPRGVRVAKESGRQVVVTIADTNQVSLTIARRNAKENRVLGRCTFRKAEAASFLTSLGRADGRFDYVDVDPFGTPAHYIQPLLNAVSNGGVASVTATDTAVLCGVHPGVCVRRYGAQPLNREFNHETGLRILINACRRVAGTLDLGIAPIAAHCTRHYIRAYFRVLVGATKADDALKMEGYVVVCKRCGERRMSPHWAGTCDACGSKAWCAGPLWTGDLCDPAMSRSAARSAESLNFSEASRILNSVPEANGLPPWGYSLDLVSSGLGVPTVPPSGVTRVLEGQGFRVSKQPYETTGFKTDAGMADVISAAKAATGRARG